MLNPFYGPALDLYLMRFERALEGSGGPLPRAMYHDSFEYSCDWSPNLFDQFERRRGYRLQMHLPALSGEGDAEQVARVKCDYRETVSDLMLEDFIRKWVQWSHAKGCATRNQAHGSPANLLDLYAAADIPETEMFHDDRDPLICKFASSAAHVAGRPLVAAETGTWLGEHFTVTLAQMKRLVDELFVAGVNHVIYHGSCYSPAEAAWPGWVFYASTQMNPRNSIWRDAATLNRYIARCQSILQSGHPANDVLLYWPIHDLWTEPSGLVRPLTVHRTDWLTEQPLGQLARRLWDRGHTFDYISDRQLTELTVRDGRIDAAETQYKVVVVPSCRFLPVDTMRCLLDLARAGGTVIFEDVLPLDVPGLSRLAERQAQLQRLKMGLSLPGDPAGAAAAKVGQGQVLVGDVGAALAAAGVRRETMVDQEGIGFVRRRYADGYHYLIVNQGERGFDGWLELATPARCVVILDAMTGQVGVADWRVVGDNVQARVSVPAGGSIILRTLTGATVDGPRWTYVEPAGESVELTGPWQLRFVDGQPQLPAPCVLDELISWTDLHDAQARSFAGTGRYTLRFDAPAGRLGPWRLELGQVAESAQVRLNRREVGRLIAAPYQLLLPQLRPSDNVLEIEVTNLSANRIRDLDRRQVAWKVFHDINFVNIDYRPFDASGWALRPSGLLGPVRLNAVHTQR
jgi:hypothetical protein